MPATVLDPKTALVVIDLQKGLAALPTVHPFAGVVQNTVKLADAFRKRALPVVLVTVSFAPDASDRPRGRTDAPPRALGNNPDATELVPELAGHASDLRIVKHQWNAFYDTGLDLQLRRRGVTSVLMAGVATSIGVDTTARAAYERNYNVGFATDAMTDIDIAGHDHAIGRIFPRMGESDVTASWLKLLA
jgi:nicotinamidase-related amidase